VVQRRVAIAVLQVLHHVAEAEVGLMDADRLVQPDPARHREAQRRPDPGHRKEHEQRGARAGVGLPARGKATARTEEVRLTSATEALPQ
jgi:hypothetical protein